jgi:hypothetical protein
MPPAQTKTHFTRMLLQLGAPSLQGPRVAAPLTLPHGWACQNHNKMEDDYCGWRITLTTRTCSKIGIMGFVSIKHAY